MKKIIAIVGGASVLIVGALCTVGAIRRKAQKNLAAKVTKKPKVKAKRTKSKTKKTQPATTTPTTEPTPAK